SNGILVAVYSPPVRSGRRSNHVAENALPSHTTATKPSAGGACADRESPGAAGHPAGNVVESRSREATHRSAWTPGAVSAGVCGIAAATFTVNSKMPASSLTVPATMSAYAGAWNETSPTGSLYVVIASA